ncbi:MAG: ABC transporter permease [Fibrobacteres bacterium]|jgi:phospholipid/cholesterol/gamma-HCH transport system permease protein|nr:ABC transporter permease [Fibrobacterota bacterium]
MEKCKIIPSKGWRLHFHYSVANFSLPPRLDRAWALGQGGKLAELASREDLVLLGGEVEEVDLLSVGAIHHARRLAAKNGRKLSLSSPTRLLLDRLAALDPGPEDKATLPSPQSPFLERVGMSAWGVFRRWVVAGQFAGAMIFGLLNLFTGKQRTWPRATWRQLHELGTSALPVVLLLTGLIGLTLALLMGQQLAQYGASIHLATLMGVAFIREVGPLLTAVILAGRSGSAITAELASMKVQEEVDALRTMGADEASFLVAPRLLALVISMPILALLASICGILAGLVIAVFQLGLSPDIYFQVLLEAIEAQDIFFLWLKSAVFAAIIAFLACRIGLSTRGGSDAVGRATTKTVVAGIFWTVIADCVFALVLYL